MMLSEHLKEKALPGKSNSTPGNSSSKSTPIYSLAIEAWVTRERTGQKEVVVSKWSEATDGQSWRLYIDDDDTPCFEIRDGNSGETFTVRAKTTLKEVYQPYHLAAVYDALSSYEHKILVNGENKAWRWICKKEELNWELGSDGITALEDSNDTGNSIMKIHLHTKMEGENIDIKDILQLNDEHVSVESFPTLKYPYGYADYEINVTRGVHETDITEHIEETKIFRITADSRGIAASATETSIGHVISGSYPFHGSINEVQILHEALTDKQIKDSFEAARLRSFQNLQALYTFQEGSGNIIKDVSGAGDPLNLMTADESAVNWDASAGSLILASANPLQSDNPAAKLTRAAKVSNEITIEAWIKPPKENPLFLTPIVTLSSGLGGRNFTLGQFQGNYHARLQTSDTEHGGSDQPLVHYDGVVPDQLVHLVYTRSYEKENDTGKARFFIAGKEVCQRRINGDFSNWDDAFALTLGNYPGGDETHTWMGSFHFVAIYDRALTPVEVFWNNQSPVVYAGSDKVVFLKKGEDKKDVTVQLSGIVVLDDQPGSEEFTTNWTTEPPSTAVTIEHKNSLNAIATFNQSGSYVLTLTAAGVSDQLTITVIENRPPEVVITSPPNETNVVIQSSPEQTIVNTQNPVTNPVTLEAVVMDDGIPDPVGRLTMAWTIIAPENNPRENIFSSRDSEFTQATFSEPGPYTLRLTVSDGNFTINKDLNLHVYASPKVEVKTESLINLPNKATLNGTLHDDGLGGQGKDEDVTYFWIGEGPDQVMFENSQALTTTASFKKSGIYTLILTVNNGFIEIQVKKTIVVNEVPVVNAGPDQVIVLPATAQMAGIVTDDGLPDPPGALTIQWEAVSGTEPLQTTVNIADLASPNTTATFSTNGTYILRLTASDGAATSSDEVSIMVHQVPVIDAGPDQTIAFKTTCQLNGMISNDGLGAPGTGKILSEWKLVKTDAQNGTVSFANQSALDTTATFTKQGDYLLRLTVNNGHRSSSDELTIHVGPPGQS